MIHTDAREDWQVPHLSALDKPALIDLFATLSPPVVGEMNGEYAGFDYLGQSEDTFAAALGRIKAGAGTFWLGKGFPGEEDGGASGYNRIRNVDGSVSRKDRFGIHRGISPIDGKPTLLLKYSDFDNPAGSIGFLDEVRKVNDRLFLCTGTPEEGRGEVGFFFLAGPPVKHEGPDDAGSELLAAADR